MIRGLVIWAVQAVTLVVMTLFLDGLQVDRIGTALLAVFMMTLLNAVIATVELYPVALCRDHLWNSVFCTERRFCLAGRSIHQRLLCSGFRHRGLDLGAADSGQPNHQFSANPRC